VVAVSALVLVAAALTRSFAAFSAWLLVVPASGLFWLADDRLLSQWRTELLALWVLRQLDFAVLRETILANPALPKGTLEGMLMTLPSVGDLVEEQKVHTPTRKAIAAATLAEHRARTDALLVNVIASAIVVVSVITAIWSSRWLPLSGMISLMLVPVARSWALRVRRSRCEIEVAALQIQPGFSDADYQRLRADIAK